MQTESEVERWRAIWATLHILHPAAIARALRQDENERVEVFSADSPISRGRICIPEPFSWRWQLRAAWSL